MGPPKQKRAKLHAEVRQEEMQHLKTLLENIKDNIKIKEARVERAKLVKDYKLCDQMSAEIRQLLKDKADYERQLSSIERKEQKSIWYHSKNKKSKTKKKDGPTPKDSNALTKMFKPVEKDALFPTTSTTTSPGSRLSETSCTTNTSGVPESNTVITIDETAVSETPKVTCSLERSASISSDNTLTVHSSDEDF